MIQKYRLTLLLPLLLLGISHPSANAQEIDGSVQKHIAIQKRNNLINKDLPSILSIDDSITYSRRLEQEYGIAPASELYRDVWVNRWINPYRSAGVQLPDTSPSTWPTTAYPSSAAKLRTTGSAVTACTAA